MFAESSPLEDQAFAANVGRRPLQRTHAPGHFRTSDGSETGLMNDRFESTAAIGRWPLEGAHPPKRSLKGRRRLSTPDAGRTSAVRSAEHALPTHCCRSRPVIPAVRDQSSTAIRDPPPPPGERTLKAGSPTLASPSQSSKSRTAVGVQRDSKRTFEVALTTAPWGGGERIGLR